MKITVCQNLGLFYIYYRDTEMKKLWVLEGSKVCTCKVEIYYIKLLNGRDTKITINYRSLVYAYHILIANSI